MSGKLKYAELEGAPGGSLRVSGRLLGLLFGLARERLGWFAIADNAAGTNIDSVRHARFDAGIGEQKPRQQED